MIEDSLIKNNSRLCQASSRLDTCDVIDTNVYCKSPTNSSESEDSSVLPSKSYHMKESGAADINTQKSGSSSTKTFPEIVSWNNYVTHSNQCIRRLLFPCVIKLKEILSDPENKDAISWLPSGKSFLVLDRKIFVQKVLPKYLGKATKYTSFTRKLSRWNFVRISNGPDEGAWMNKVRLQ
jgi:HSF-type DNA-binding